MDHQRPLQWSSTYAVASPSPSSSSSQSSTTHRGDKILLPHSALSGLLSAARNRYRNRNGITTTSSAFRRNPLAGSSSDDIVRGFYFDIPHPEPGVESTLEAESQLPHPLTFRLENCDNGRVVYAGVREFSAREGEVVLTRFLWDALGVDEDDSSTKQNDSSTLHNDVSIKRNDPPTKYYPLRIAVMAHQLPKGKHVRLRPLEAGYVPTDWRPLLEREFRRSFTTLTHNTVVSVLAPTGADEYRFLVDRVGGAQTDNDGDDNNETPPAICVVDTDLEVDIEALNEEQARETVARMMQNHTRDGGEIDVWKPVSAEVAPGRWVDFTLPAWDRARPLVVELSGLDDEAAVDLFVSPRSARFRALPRDDEHVFGVFDAPVGGKKTITIQPTNEALDEAESILIAVHGYDDKESIMASNTESNTESNTASTTPFTLRARVSLPSDPSSDTTPDISLEVPPDHQRCPNCHQPVPTRTLVLHESFCRRNNVPCPHHGCSRIFKRDSSSLLAHWHCPHDSASGSSPASRARHDSAHHSPRTCQPCGISLPSLAALAAHRISTCPEKLILCRFCHLDVPQEGADPTSPAASQAALRGMTEHEFLEGARTTECHLCARLVRLLDMSSHLLLHEHDRAARKTPLPCPNPNCGRILNGPLSPPDAKLSDPASFRVPTTPPVLCAHCAAPLHASVYDPDGAALRRRIERRYLTQMMVGCARPWCRNEFCRSGRAGRGMEPTGRGTRDVLPLVKPLTEKNPGSGGPVWLCVDEASAAMRAAAETLAKEGAWELAWCVAACEVEGGKLDRAREWLVNWAPVKTAS